MVVVGVNLLSSFLSILAVLDHIHSLGQQVSYCLEQRKFSLSKTEVFNPTGFFWYTNMATVSMFWTPIWQPWRHVKTFYTSWYLEFSWYDSKTSNFGAQQRQNRNCLIHIYWILMEIYTHVMFYICIVVNTESENSNQGQIPAEEKESVTVPESPIPDLPPRSHRTLSVSIVV